MFWLRNGGMTLGGMTLVLLLVLGGWPAGPGAQSREGESPLAGFLASPFVAAFDPVPSLPRESAIPGRPMTVGGNLQAFVAAPFVAAFIPAAPVPTGQCRWQRPLLDAQGRPVVDRYGRPLLEVRIGPCPPLVP